jgi:XTP/dITP diphosphohydrolase
VAKTLDVRFVSRNKHKIAEAKTILGAAGIEVVPYGIEIEEIQTSDTEKLVRDKLLKAYRKVARPVFVEHTGLHLTKLNGLPGGLTQVFWDALKEQQFSALFGNGDSSAVAATTVAYCDGRNIKLFEGKISGHIVAEPLGPTDFQWDCVFLPDHCSQTFAEMGEYEKNKISMRRIALDALATHIRSKHGHA